MNYFSGDTSIFEGLRASMLTLEFFVVRSVFETSFSKRFGLSLGLRLSIIKKHWGSEMKLGV